MEILVAKAKALPPDGQCEVLDFVEFLETRLGGGHLTRACPARWPTWASICQPRTLTRSGARPDRNFPYWLRGEAQDLDFAPERTAKSATAVDLSATSSER